MEDDVSNGLLLLSVLLDELDKELVDQHFKVVWDVPQVAGLHHVDDLLQRGTPDDFVLCLRIVSDELPKDYDHVIVNFDREGHATDAGPVKNFQQ